VFIAGFQATSGDDIDRAAKQHRELVLEMEQIEQGATSLEVDHKVNVAVFGVVAASDRPEHRYRSTAMAADSSGDLVSVLIHEQPTLSHETKANRQTPPAKVPGCLTLTRRFPHDVYLTATPNCSQPRNGSAAGSTSSVPTSGTYADERPARP